MKAANGNNDAFQSEIKEAIDSVSKSIEKAQQIVADPSISLPKARLAEIYNSMTKDYTEGLRALEEIILAKARM